MRVVLDANVLIAAALTPGSSRRIVQAWLNGEAFALVICDRLVDDVRRVLTTRPHPRRWISVPAAERYLQALVTLAEVLPDPLPGPAVTRDPKDDYVIHLARIHDADCIVSGDADLLAWPEQDPPVIPPAWLVAHLLDR